MSTNDTTLDSPQPVEGQPTPHPEVEVELSGQDGNAFAIIGAVAKALRRAGFGEDADLWRTWAMDSTSYDELLQRAMTTVDVS